MRSRQVRRAILLASSVVVVAVLGWTGWVVVQTYRDLSAAAAAAALLQETVASGDESGSRQALSDLTDHTQDAAGRTSGVTWWALEHLPLTGDDARGVRVASEVLANLSRDGLAPMIDSVDAIEALTPREGLIPLDAATALQEPVARAARAFTAADSRLAAEDSSSYLGRWQLRYRELASRVSGASAALAAADKAVQVLPTMLGRDEPRRYLVVFQNNAEVRATGGLPGAVAVIEARGGRIELVRQVAPGTLPETLEPVLPLTPAERSIYGEQLGTWFLDANFTPDFPRAAELWRAHYEQDFDDIDGVVSLDVVTLGYVLAATGPVQSGDLTLTADDVVATLLNTVYLQIPDPAAQDVVFQDVARVMFDRVTSGVGSPQVLLDGLQQAVDQGRVHVHSFHLDEQEVLAGTRVAGELVTDSGADPQVGVYLNDNTGSKMSFYLRTTASVSAQTCVGSVQALVGTATLTSRAPAEGLPASVTGGGYYGIAPGAQLVAVRLYGPVGGTIGDIELEGEPVDGIELVTQDDRQVATTFVYLEPDDGVALTWGMTTGRGQTGDVEVSVTPGIEARNSSSVADSAC